MPSYLLPDIKGEDLRLIGFVDDVAAPVIERTDELAQTRLCILIRRVNAWITANGFTLAIEKPK